MQIKTMDIGKKPIHAIVAIFLVTINIILKTTATKLNASEAFDSAWSTESDLENELEQKRAKTLGWSTWSEWSTCSRSCDGGVTQQTRKCHSPNGCRGETVRYKTCNMQPCPEAQDFRANQCAAYNDVPYDGTLFNWTPHYDYAEPCALTCRGRPAHLTDDQSTSDPFDEPTVIVQLSIRVQDGTRCRTGSLNMCIQGKCQRIGCDLKIGSGKKVDACGVCDGDGSSCSQPLYHWEMVPMSLCSITCGGGYKMSIATCRNRVTGADVEESLCSGERPESSVVECNTHLCPPRWIAEEWSLCSKICGGGYRQRTVVCAEDKNGLKSIVPDLLCRTSKPSVTEQCNLQECPKWEATEWSGDTEGTSQSEEESFDHISYNDKPFYSNQISNHMHLEELPPVAEKLIGDEHATNEPSFIKDHDWSPCSVTCGEGIRKRSYRCKILLEFSQIIATLNDTLCEGRKPHDQVETCFEEPCSLPYENDESYPRDSIKVGVSEPGKTYVWREQGYTSCSASCLGGVEELIINCIREDNGKIVSPFLCSPETKPEARVRTCNDRQCPPRWNYSEYTPCSKSCGIGIKTREIQCIHEVTRGGENTMVVPNNMCPQPPPADRQYCNVLDCPVRWEVSEWSKCSQSCGYGIKERRVECKQIMAQEHKIERHESMCPSARPTDKKPCNVKPCPPEDPKPVISISNSTYIQHDLKKNKITLKIGGAAEVFFGTQIKIKCPVKRYNRTKIRWSKDHKFLGKSKRFKVSKKGALRILDIIFRDAGVYTCHAGLSSAEINLEVKPRPDGIQPNDDYDRTNDESDRSIRDRSGTEFLTSADNVDRLSNEKKQQKERTRNRQRLDGLQHADSSIMEDESKLTQQSQDGVPQTAASSSGSRTFSVPSPISYFQTLLSNLQYL